MGLEDLHGVTGSNLNYRVFEDVNGVKISCNETELPSDRVNIGDLFIDVSQGRGEAIITELRKRAGKNISDSRKLLELTEVIKTEFGY